MLDVLTAKIRKFAFQLTSLRFQEPFSSLDVPDIQICPYLFRIHPRFQLIISNNYYIVYYYTVIIISYHITFPELGTKHNPKKSSLSYNMQLTYFCHRNETLEQSTLDLHVYLWQSALSILPHSVYYFRSPARYILMEFQI